jgi:uncharacterized membrane protein YeiH
MSGVSETGRLLSRRSDAAVLVLDVAAVFVFAVEGAAVAAAAGFDVFGVLVTAVVSALTGGTIRDVLIGDLPPVSIRAVRYLVVTLIAGGATFLFDAHIRSVPSGVLTTLDAAGLGLFAVSGAAKALDFDIAPIMAVAMGTLTAVGGGVARDLLLNRVPLILRSDVYAVCAVLGAGVFVIGERRGVRRIVMMILGGAACFALRVVAAHYHWGLPAVRRASL